MKTRISLWTAGVLLPATFHLLAQCPTIIRQPASRSASLGATVVFQVTATTTNPPLTYQWRHAEAEIAGATNRTLTLTNITWANNGAYRVSVSDAGCSTLSEPAALDVDVVFTKIMTNALVAEKGHWHSAAWGDCDDDGYPDLSLHKCGPPAEDLLFHNNRDGTFTRIALPFYTMLEGVWGCAWGDYDNDGLLDLFLPHGNGENVLFHNRGGGDFERIVAGPGQGNNISTSGAWGDYDRDGWLDLFVVNSMAGLSAGINQLWRNQGDGTFAKMAASDAGDIVRGSAPWMYASWADYDDDGWSDLLTTVWTGSKPYLYRNLRDGAFTRITNNALVNTNLPITAFAWADYDNDGRLDLFLGMDGVRPDRLYHNDGAGAFRLMTTDEVGPVASDSTAEGGAAWGDYDNDGFQDLFVAGGWYLNSQYTSRTNFLYHNNGDGTFSRLRFGSPANEVGEAMGAYWIDYDRDGFLDLFVQNHGAANLEAHCLYRNNGNANAWLEVNCVGTSSPRFGTGAKVRVLASISGLPLWQLRLVDAGGTCLGGQSFIAHFGLGDATNVDLLRIEWPSGIVQELTNVAVRQHLTVTEPPKLEATGRSQFRIRSWRGMAFDVESSTDLSHWTSVGPVTNLTGTLDFSDLGIDDHTACFYRVRKL